MNENKIVSFSELTLHDLLTVDVYDKTIQIRNNAGETATPLISEIQFFRKDGLYVEPEVDGLSLIENEDDYEDQIDQRKKKPKKSITIDELLEELDTATSSTVVLIEGYAGCGKSTLAQSILTRQLGIVSDYSLYNYNIEAQNDAIIHDKDGNKIENSSIFNAIRTSFAQEFCKAYHNRPNIISDFKSLLYRCENNKEFKLLYWEFVTSKTYNDIEDNLRIGNINSAKGELYRLLQKIGNDNCTLALDYLLRLSMWKNRLIEHLYICYDNLDAIEDADDLKNFDKKLVRFRNQIDKFINANSDLLNNHIPHFVILATYRKITSVLAKFNKSYSHSYNEVNTDDPDIIPATRVLRIDATSTYSYKKIVAKRKDFFKDFFDNYPHLSEPSKTRIYKVLEMLKHWDILNNNLEIMQNRYAILWNRNYRTCSLIAHILFSIDKYNFKSSVDFINNSAKEDGYNIEYDDSGNTVLCTYFGGSAILLSSVCQVFNNNHIWDELLRLTHLHEGDPACFEPAFDDVSLSRLILTYLYNRGVVSLLELYNTFCKHDLFSTSKLCQCLSKMLERNKQGVWRRPLYYANECILATEAEDIKQKLLEECYLLDNGNETAHSYMFQLCDSGRAYVERLMSEFEFFSNRLHRDNKPLYMYKKKDDLKRIISCVFNAVYNCCKNMLCFKDKFMESHNITLDKYLQFDFHPKTYSGSHQLHTERIIFSHIAYINNVRLYFVNGNASGDLNKQKEYNALFLSFINAYLNLYRDLICPVSSERVKVYEKLHNIVLEIEKENEKSNPNLDVLFKSVALNPKKSK